MQEQQVHKQFVEVLKQILLQTRTGPRFCPDERFHHEIWSDETGFLTTAISLAPFTKAQLFQDAWVIYELQFKRNGFFVEIGASDGVMSSNTFMLEKEFAWTGVLAEPHPVTGPRLRDNRSCYISKSMCIDYFRGSRGFRISRSRSTSFYNSGIFGGRWTRSHTAGCAHGQGRNRIAARSA